MNFDSIFAAAHSSIVKGADNETAARAVCVKLAAAKGKSKHTIASLLAADRASTLSGEALKVANVAIAANLRAVLSADGVDVSDGKAVRDALRPGLWADEGAAMPEKGAAKPEKGTDEFKLYERIATRLTRLATRVVGADKPAAQRVPARAARVPSVIMDVVVARKDAGKSKAEIRAELLAALDRAFA